MAPSWSNSDKSSPRLGQDTFDRSLGRSQTVDLPDGSQDTLPIYTISNLEKNSGDGREKDEKPAKATVARPTLASLISIGSRDERVPVLLAAAFFSTVCGLIPPYMTEVIGQAFGVFARFASETSVPNMPEAIRSESRAKLMSDTRVISLQLVGLTFGMLLASTAASTLWVMNGERTIRSLRQHLFDAITSKSMSWFDMGCTNGTSSNELPSDGPGGLVGRFTKCTDEVKMATSQNMGQILQYLVCFLACLVLSFVRDYRLTFVILASVPVIAIVTAITERFAQNWIALDREYSAQASTEADRILGAVTTIKAFGAEEAESKRFAQIAQKARQAYVRLHFVWGIRTGFSQFLLLAMFVQGFWFGAWLVKSGRNSAAAVNTCFYAVLLATTYLQACIPLLVTLEKGKTALQALLEILSDEPLDFGPSSSNAHLVSSIKVDSPVSPSFPPLVPILNSSESPKTSSFRLAAAVKMRKIRPDVFSGEISLRHVTFWYPTRPAPAPAALTDVNVYFAPRETTFVVGGSGSGKSTVSGLIIGLYRPNAGRIEFDEQDCEVIDEDWLRARVLCVSQGSAFLISGTVHDNVALGIAGATDENGIPLTPTAVCRERVKAACQFALLHEFINDLPLGYDTWLNGDKDSALSGGQRQRLAIARAWLRDPKVLILDEATAALDITSRGLIHDAIRAWRANQTTIIVTHDLAQIQDDDFVYVLENGRMLQHGYRASLQAVPGAFARLASQQASLAKSSKGHLADDHNGEDVAADAECEDREQLRALPKGSESCLVAASATDGQRSSWRHSMLTGLSVLPAFSRPVSLQPQDFDDAWQVTISRRQRLGPRNATLPIDSDTKAKKTTSPTSTHVKIPLRRMLLDYHRTMPGRPLLWLGCAFSAVVGACTPIFSSLLSQVMASIGSNSSSKNITSLSLIILGVAFVDGVCTFLKFYVMERCAMQWITRLREDGLSVLLRQDKMWFDEPEHPVSKVTHMLIKDTEDARTLVGTVIGHVFVVVTMITFGLTWAFVVGWELTCVGFAIAPLFLIITRVQAVTYGRLEERNKKLRESLSFQLHQSVSNVRAVRAMGAQRALRKTFCESVGSTYKASLLVAPIAGLGVGLGNSLTYAAEALMFYVSAVLIGNGRYTYEQMMQVFTLIIFSVTFAGQIMAYLPAMTRAIQACRDFEVIRKLNKDTEESKGNLEFSTNGRVSFKDVSFAYPTRATESVLRGISFDLRAGECVALVGASGCGKSTLIQLLQRFYEPTQGQILLDGHPLHQTSVDFLRRQMAVVSQQPTLFDLSVRDNIAYGSDSETTDLEIIRAAKAANIHEFISTLSEGYNTKLGHFASLISGGQAQRLQIARAFLRDCKILVLDECTSALDATNQAAVMRSISKAKVGRTTIVITHKLDVMRTCDRIIVLQDGKVAEQGQVEELLSKGGAFAELARGGEWA